MGQTLHEIPEPLIEWINKQHIFWVASAPLASDGHVNISPKGVQGTFHVINSHKVWYEDLSGTGVETIAHIRENGRVTVLFNAFDGPPKIVRLYGRGSVHEIGTPEYKQLLPDWSRKPGSRAVIIIDVYKVGTTCGYAVPRYTFVSHRNQLLDWAAKKEEFDRGKGPVEYGMKAWWTSRNTKSLDGLPGLTSPHEPTGTASPMKTTYPFGASMVVQQMCTQVRDFIDLGHAVAFFFGILCARLFLYRCF